MYAVEVDGAGLQGALGVANVGVRPTVDDSIKANLEVHLLDFSGDLYGRDLEFEFLARMRDEQRFESLEALREQIGRDVAGARELLATSPARGT